MPNAQGTRLLDPFGHFNFAVEIEGLSAGAFRDVEGIGMQIEEIEFQDGTDLWPKKRPGRKKFSNIRLKKGFINKNVLFKWMMETMQGKLSRKSGSIILHDDAGVPVMRYNFFEAWPKSWSGIRFDGNSQGVQVEEVEIVIERLEMG